jgi:hypothetical protein
MINEGVVSGIEDLINSANWNSYCSPVLKELRTTFGYSQQENSTLSIKIEQDNRIQFEFTEDELGTIVIIRLLNQAKENEVLSHLMSKLKKNGHILDSFLMNDPLIQSPNVINIEKIRELLKNKELDKLRAIEARCNAHLAWPLLPFSVVKLSDSLLEEQYFNQCQVYHQCLRISIDLSGGHGKLERFVKAIKRTLDEIELTNAIAVSNDLKPSPSNWALIS